MRRDSYDEQEVQTGSITNVVFRNTRLAECM